nr:MAG TPA: hypothetical protein [Caudoviricetes sp.]
MASYVCFKCFNEMMFYIITRKRRKQMLSLIR